MEEHSIRELANSGKCLIHGRTMSILNPNRVGENVPDGCMPLFFTGSAFEFNVKCSSFSITLYTDYDYLEQWVSVYINGAFSTRLMLPKGIFKLDVFRGMNDEKVKNVRVMKEVQPFSDEKSNLFLGVKAECDGEFLEVEERDLKIEFIGDSITSSEGCAGSKEDQDWIPMFFSAGNSYSFMVANDLNADYRIISQSGWGLLCGWDGNPYSNIPEYYTRVCGMLKGDKQLACGCNQMNIFEMWQPNYIVLNLGTNDTSAFEQPEWKGENGETFNLRLNEDGTYNEDSVKLWKGAADRFLRILRANNPEATILWTLGMLGSKLVPIVKTVISEYQSATGDTKVTFIQLEESNDETVGSRCHPGVKCHRAAADKIIEYIKNDK